MINMLEDKIFTDYYDSLDTESVIKEIGTPLFLYDADIITDRYNYLVNSIDWPQKRVFYAMKANFNPAILIHLESIGSSIDAVSPAEVFLAMKCGFTPDRIMFTSNNITDEEMFEVADTGVLFNIDSLSRLEKFGRAFPGRDVCLRINTDVTAGEHKHIQTAGTETKFGIPADKVEKAASIAAAHKLRVTGLHKHAGSGIADKEVFLKSMENLVSFADPLKFPDLEFIDFGGGYKAPYHPDEVLVDYEDFGCILNRESSSYPSAAYFL